MELQKRCFKPISVRVCLGLFSLCHCSLLFTSHPVMVTNKASMNNFTALRDHSNIKAKETKKCHGLVKPNEKTILSNAETRLFPSVFRLFYENK